MALVCSVKSNGDQKIPRTIRPREHNTHFNIQLKHINHCHNLFQLYQRHALDMCCVLLTDKKNNIGDYTT